MDRPGITRTLFVLMLLAVWEIAGRAFGDPLFIATPLQIIVALPQLITVPGIAPALLTTGWEVLIAFALALFFGFCSGLLLGRIGFAHRSLMPIVVMLYALPQVTIIPLFMMSFGIGPASKIAYGVSHGIFPIIITVSASMGNVPSVLLKSARSMGASRWQTLLNVLLPHSAPGLFAGMRLGLNATLLGVILAELYASKTGVGYFAQKFAINFEPKLLFALVALIAALAIVLNEGLRRLEARISFWRDG
ncbi:NitT/TauT family transport system permease protein [Beijerinckia sp. 28-YEA-48]|nr:NitT/TauT family transport system permease protein [Beijerinckia sp. 28-YEA-48]